MTPLLKISQLVLLVCVVLVTSTEGGFYGEGERHVYAGAEDYPTGLRDQHAAERGRQARPRAERLRPRSQGLRERAGVRGAESVRCRYASKPSPDSQFYGGGVGPIGHDHVGFYGTGVRVRLR
uniref:Putative sidestep protein n=1 Tax=Ixodes ricinus TaxID=34613 RepID=A0A090X8Y6_IXORI